MIVPTAEEILNKHLIPANAMIEFAKLHLKAQEEAILQNVTTTNEPHWSGEQEDDVSVDIDSILNAYPIENVK
jgi:hypothetical protein